MNTNRYLTDNYAPVAEEITTTHLRVTRRDPARTQRSLSA